MPRVTCRCGEKIKVPAENLEHMDCPRCGTKIRLRRAKSKGTTDGKDGFIRFLCPCGRRLKVSAIERPKAGRCPDCGRVVPVPTSALGTMTHPDQRDKRRKRALQTWTPLMSPSSKSGRHATWPVPLKPQAAPVDTGPVAVVAPTDNNELGVSSNTMPRASVVKFETGLRICPRCKKPLHLSADNCRECGMPFPASKSAHATLSEPSGRAW